MVLLAVGCNVRCNVEIVHVVSYALNYPEHNLQILQEAVTTVIISLNVQLTNP